MSLTLLGILDLVGTIAFAIAGAIVAVRKEMDIFGINVLAVCTATGGGMIRDILIGNTPPNMFRNAFYVAVAAVTANIVFLLQCFGKCTSFRRVFLENHEDDAGRWKMLYDRVLFLFDTLGLAAFTIDGAAIGIQEGYKKNLFLIVFLGMMTGVGGGVLRDILANRMPDILHKQIYALSSIPGGLVLEAVLYATGRMWAAMMAGFATVILIRSAAVRFDWQLPRIMMEAE